MQIDYHEQEQQNREKFMELMAVAMPDLHILATLLEKQKINPIILFHVSTHLAEIARGTGYGKVEVMVEEGDARFVKGLHQTKLIGEKVFLTEEKEPNDEVIDEN